jgi:hypothetical protein
LVGFDIGSCFMLVQSGPKFSYLCFIAWLGWLCTSPVHHTASHWLKWRSHERFAQAGFNLWSSQFLSWVASITGLSYHTQLWL